MGDQLVQMTNLSIVAGDELSRPDQTFPVPCSISSKAMCVCLWGPGLGHGVASLEILAAQKRVFFSSPASALAPAMNDSWA